VADGKEAQQIGVRVVGLWMPVRFRVPVVGCRRCS
jgi:hypothetical protein